MRFLIFIFICTTVNLTAQNPIEKFSEQLKLELEKIDKKNDLLVWIFLKDKGTNTTRYFAKPLSILSEKSLQRRSKVLKSKQLIEETDLPVYQNYIDRIRQIGFVLKQKSKWFNAVSGYISSSRLSLISELPFVQKIDIVARFKKDYEKQNPSYSDELLKLSYSEVDNLNTYDYGSSFTQLKQINVPAIHDMGYTGQDVTICVMDAGFNRLTHEVFSRMNIVAAYDFVNNDSGVGDSTDMGSGTHGTEVLSIIGGFAEGKLIGPAFNSNFILAKTENTESETPIEEDNWIAALEWADSIGVEITSTSLSYLDFDLPFTSYTWEDMDGNTARITIAADLAVKKGILIFNSTGNEGYNAARNTLVAPADGDSVIAVGAVDSMGVRSSFSSVGNTVDGRIKPDIMAMGTSVKLASPANDAAYSYGNGTSYSCPLAAGVAALILSYNPSLTPMQVRDAIRNTASKNQNPDREYGWGIINAVEAINYLIPVELISFYSEVVGSSVQIYWITASEVNNQGFTIERRTEKTAFESIGFVSGSGSGTSEKKYNFSDNVTMPGTYFYRLKQIDFNGTFEFSDEIQVTVLNPTEISISQNYPNPFNPSTRFRYTLPVTSKLKIYIYDLLGNKLGEIFHGIQESGTFENRISANDFSPPLTSGVYFVKFESESFQKSIKIVLAK